MCRLRGLWLESHIADGRWLVTMKADVVALARLIRYSEEEALRLGVSGVVVECLRMAGIELTNTIDNASSAGSPPAAKAASIN
jgi:hypothetical protein